MTATPKWKRDANGDNVAPDGKTIVHETAHGFAVIDQTTGATLAIEPTLAEAKRVAGGAS